MKTHDLNFNDTLAAPARPSQLVLSLFPGIGLLDRGFEHAGFTVVRGPDIIWGGDIRAFHALPGKFDGIIGGPPFQNFSTANPKRDFAVGMALVAEYLRVVNEAQPTWALMENVAGSPNCDAPSGYCVQRFTLDASHVGSDQRRLRKFHFFSRPGFGELLFNRDRSRSRHELNSTCLASEGRFSKNPSGRRKGRRTWEKFCELQGLPAGFDLQPFTVAAKYRAVGNGVPFPLAVSLAHAIATATHRGVTPFKLCPCGCGEPLHGKERLASPACRKREQRRREALATGAPKQFGLVMQNELPVKIPKLTLAEAWNALDACDKSETVSLQPASYPPPS